MEWVEIAAKKTNRTPCYFISSSGVFIFENTMNQQVRAIASLYCILSSIWKKHSWTYLHPFCEWSNKQKIPLVTSKEPFRAESRNLNPVSIFCQLYFTWYNMLYLFYADFVSSHQSEEFLLLLPPNSYFSTAWVFNVLDCLLPNGSEYIKTRTHTPPTFKIG